MAEKLVFESAIDGLFLKGLGSRVVMVIVDAPNLPAATYLVKWVE